MSPLPDSLMMSPVLSYMISKIMTKPTQRFDCIRCFPVEYWRHFAGHASDVSSRPMPGFPAATPLCDGGTSACRSSSIVKLTTPLLDLNDFWTSKSCGCVVRHPVPVLQRRSSPFISIEDAVIGSTVAET